MWYLVSYTFFQLLLVVCLLNYIIQGIKSDQSGDMPDLLWVIGLQGPYRLVTIWLLYFAYHMYFVCYKLLCMYHALLDSYAIHVWPEFICNKVMFMFFINNIPS